MKIIGTLSLFLSTLPSVFLGLIVIAGCTHSPLSERRPSGIFEDYDAAMDELTRLKFPLKEKLGIEKPWEFVQGNYVCNPKTIAPKPLPLSAPSDQDLEAELEISEQTRVNEWIHQANSYTFSMLSCDQRYRDILTDLVKAVQNPKYAPRLHIDDGAISTEYFIVKKYEGMAFTGFSNAKVNSLVEVPKFENPERSEVAEIKNSPTLINFPGTQMGNLFFITEQGADHLHCRVQVKNGINNQIIDQFYTVCSGGVESTFAPFLWNEEAFVIYADLNFVPTESKPLSPEFVYRLHKITSSLSQKPDIARYFDDQAKERVVLQHLSKEFPANGPDIFMPTSLTVSTDGPDEKIQLAIHGLYQGASYLKAFEFQKTDLKLDRTINIADGRSEALQVNAFYGNKIYYTSYSKQNLAGYYSFDLKSQQRVQVGTTFQVKHKNYQTKLLFYPAKDGRKLPIWITHRTDLKLRNPKNFGIVSAYGGFNTIAFSPMSAAELSYDSILNKGGFVANIIIRGGGELGPSEFLAASGSNKQMTYDDFIAGTEFLYKMGYAGPRRIVSEGWSNGGLVVLKTALQRPELFGAVVAGSAVTDVLNLKKLDKENGENWLAVEYGDLADPKMKAYWQINSPLEMLKTAKYLPPILLRTAYGDLNVNPAHSLKFYKALQERPDRRQFFLYARPLGAGHGPSTIKALIEEYSYIQSFVYRALKIP